ncbi:2-keto-3-deoxygluconate permease [Viridibacillus arvi]|uniref:2-keto-3-deoxygluconate permease n=1 Tax=Viridibacillus arvi TaxID=263475 RepID=UPI0036EC4732
MQIKKTIEKVPGGMMIIPLFLGAIINTLFPATATTLGSFTGALLTGALPILAVFYFCVGTQISFVGSPVVVKKGVTFLVVKIGTAALVGLIAVNIMPSEYITGGFFAGLSVLAIVAAMNETNVGLYMALMSQYGTEEEVGAGSIMMLESGPFLTMVTFGVAGIASFPWEFLVGTILPLVIGVTIGSLDKEMKAFFKPAVPILIPFFAFALGAGMNIVNAVRAGLLGILLGLMVIIITGFTLFLADKYILKGSGIAGLAAASSAGAVVTVPVAVAAANSKYEIMAADATALCAASVIITAILTPIIVAWYHKRLEKKKLAENPQLAVSELTIK